jgi:hypothetical protein
LELVSYKLCENEQLHDCPLPHSGYALRPRTKLDNWRVRAPQQQPNNATGRSTAQTKPKDCHLTQAVAREAEGYFLKAIEIARRQGAKSLELRAVLSLARLWQQQGRKANARQMLAEIYGGFTEGFDTKDLQDAKTLLDRLGEGTTL